MSEPSFGFGQRVTRVTTPPVDIADMATLRTRLHSLGATTPAANAPRCCWFWMAARTTSPSPLLKGRKRSSHSQSARDAIEFLSTATTSSAATTANVRITHCAFDGYYDIAIDSHVQSTGPRLLATIDHCLFFDANPGQPSKGGATFVNRGAINFANKVHNGMGNSTVTVANNVFIDVWRRTPRVAEGNQAQIFNNVLFRWGFGNNANDPANMTNEWVGMEADNRAQAVIQANRFIPWRKKVVANKTVNIDPAQGQEAQVDFTNLVPVGVGGIGTTIRGPKDTNEFDGANGTKPSPAGLPPASTATINVESWYGNYQLTPPQIGFLTLGLAMQILDAAGPPARDRSSITATLRDTLDKVSKGNPAVPPD